MGRLILRGGGQDTGGGPGPDPEPGDKPGPSNTGPTNPGILVPRGGGTINTPGTVLENFDATGQITIAASNVTLRNFRITVGGSYGIRITSGSNIIIEDGEISGMTSSGILGSGFTARRLNVYNSGADGMKPTNNVVIENCWFHHLGYITTAHSDGVQVRSGTNIIIRNNFFDMASTPGYRNSQCVYAQAEVGSGIDGLLVEGNWFGGASAFMVSMIDQDDIQCINAHLNNNRFSQENVNIGYYRIEQRASNGYSGNVFDETGEPLPDGWTVTD